MKIKTKLILMELVSLLVLANCIVNYSNYLTSDAISDRVENTLHIAIDGYNDDVCNFQHEQIEISIIKDGIHIDSSIDEAIGTTLNEDIIKTVKENGSYFHDDVFVNGERFYGYYEIIDEKIVFAGQSYEYIHSKLNMISYSLVGISIGILMLCLVLASSTASSIAKRIIKASENLIKVSHGDLTVHFENNQIFAKYIKNNKDEVTLMQNHVNTMVGKLRTIIKNIIGISNDININMSNLNEEADIISKSTSDIASAISGVSDGAVSTAEDIQHATNIVDDIGNNINGIEDSTNNLSNAATAMNDAKNKLISILNEFIEVNDIMGKNITDTSDQINITNENVKEIQKFIEVIKDIADKTNLLSINAQIEAAHAGDSGKGFAVVAGEIGKLAAESAKSSVEIETTLNNLLKNYELIISKMDITHENIFFQNTKLIETQGNFNILDNDINTTSNQIQDIDVMVKDLNLLRNDLVDIISSLSSVSEQNAAASEQTTAAIQELTSVIDNVCNNIIEVKEKANCLIDSVGIFTIEKEIKTN